MMTIGFPGSNVTPRKRNYSVNPIRVPLYQIHVKARGVVNEPWRVSSYNPGVRGKRTFFQDHYAACERMRRCAQRNRNLSYKLISI